MATLPELEDRCGSWIVSERRSGKTLGETFKREIAQHWANDPALVVKTAAQHLGDLNASLRLAKLSA